MVDYSRSRRRCRRKSSLILGEVLGKVVEGTKRIQLGGNHGAVVEES